MNHTSNHWHVALGEEGSWNYRISQFDEKISAIDFFLNMSSNTFKSIDNSARADIEYRMYDVLEENKVMLFDGSEKYMMVLFGCNLDTCMISTYN